MVSRPANQPWPFKSNSCRAAQPKFQASGVQQRDRKKVHTNGPMAFHESESKKALLFGPGCLDKYSSDPLIHISSYIINIPICQMSTR